MAPTRVYSSLLDVLHDATDDDIAILVGQGIHVQLICAVQVLVDQHRALRVHLHRVVNVALQILGAAGWGRGRDDKDCRCKSLQSARALPETAGRRVKQRHPYCCKACSAWCCTDCMSGQSITRGRVVHQHCRHQPLHTDSGRGELMLPHLQGCCSSRGVQP